MYKSTADGWITLIFHTGLRGDSVGKMIKKRGIKAQVDVDVEAAKKLPTRSTHLQQPDALQSSLVQLGQIHRVDLAGQQLETLSKHAYYYGLCGL